MVGMSEQFGSPGLCLIDKRWGKNTGFECRRFLLISGSLKIVILVIFCMIR